MSKVFDDYEHEEGHHWVERSLRSFESLAKEHTCSPELHILIGLARGIKTGTITKGDFSYTEIATKAAVGGETWEISSELLDLARNGLFTNTLLRGAKNVQPIVDHPHDLDPANWQLPVEETLFDDSKIYNSTEGAILQGIVSGTCDDTIRYGDSRYYKLAIDAVNKVDQPQELYVALELLAEAGFFGSELLLGCEPEKSTAVSRLK